MYTHTIEYSLCILKYIHQMQTAKIDTFSIIITSKKTNNNKMFHLDLIKTCFLKIFYWLGFTHDKLICKMTSGEVASLIKKSQIW